MTPTLVPDVRVRGKTPLNAQFRQAIKFLCDHVFLTAEPCFGSIDGGPQPIG